VPPLLAEAFSRSHGVGVAAAFFGRPCGMIAPRVDFRYTSDVVGHIRLYEAGNTYDMPRALAHAAAKRELIAVGQPVDWTPPSILDPRRC
jgi:hypothetical protein